MAAKSKAYEQFGHFILFKRLEGDGLSELWRAARIENDSLGATVALRRFIGGNREALSAAAWTARQIVPSLSGTSFVRNQTIDSLAGTTFIAHEYAGGRSLRHIIDRARGGTSSTPHPIPIEQAIVIAEKVALSLATTEELRMAGERLTHGALIPQFVWITDGGEIRVAGQQLGRGIVSSLRVATDLARYFAPEYQQSGLPTKASEVFSLGAILYLVVTGEEPPDAANASAFAQAVRATRTMAGTPMPDDIRAIIEKSLAIDPPARYATVADMKNALSTLVNSGRYAATTFNLAFYLSTLLKKELEGETLDRERETKTNIAPYLAALAAPPPPADAPPAQPAVPVLAAGAKGRGRLVLAIAAATVLAAAGIGAWLILGSKQTPAPATMMNLASTVTPPAVTPVPPPVVEPLVATATPETASPAPAVIASGAPGAASDEAAKKAFEDAVKQKLQQELAKLQAEYTRELRQSQARNAPVGTTNAAPPPAERVEERPLTASQLDQLRREALRLSDESATATMTETASQVVTATTAPPVVVTQTETQPPAPVVPAAPVIREGDVVEGSALDVQPQVVRVAQPIYPPLAARQRITGTVLVSALISETGDVIDVKILKGEGRLGFDEAAVRAVRSTKFAPAMKDGKRVKTWMGIPIQFKP
ncbi:MAG TPA: TonB family protein [Thermoanaerobaculia bacterium]|nr:TonB family protein [Thermoanaerobaculia bacterium]